MPKATDHDRAWGERVRELRAKRKLTPMQLAAAADIHVSKLSRIENGRVSADDQTRIAIAAALGVKVERIWSYPSAPAPTEVAS